VTYLRASATGRTCIGGSAVGLNPESGSGFFSISLPMRTTNTRRSTAPSYALISTAPARKKDGESQAIGRSRGGLSTKIHALVDALGNPIGFFLGGGEAHDLVGADHLLPMMQADILTADKAYDADQRVLEPLAAASKSVVIPAKANRREPTGICMGHVT